MNNFEESAAYFNQQFEKKFKKFITLFHGKVIYSFRVIDNHGLPVHTNVHEYRIESELYQKVIMLVYTNGINVDHESFNFQNFYVKFLGDEKDCPGRSSFGLSDYYKFIGQKMNSFYCEDPNEQVDTFFRFINSTINSKGLADILLNKTWIEIPINYDDYK